MTSTSVTSRQKTTTQSPEPSEREHQDSQPASSSRAGGDHSLRHEVLEEIRELPEEISGAFVEVREEIAESTVGRWAVNAYLWLMARAPQSTRGRVIFGSIMFLVVMAPSLALLYVSLSAGQEGTENWFGDPGYAGVFLANLAGTATLFIPVPALTAAAQALIVSSGDVLSPFWVGVLGGLGMALGEVTAYVAGMAASLIAKEEEIKPPGRLQPIIDRVTRWTNWLMANYGMPTLFVLSVVPNPAFEVAGWTAGATRYPFWRFMAAVTPGKVCRGLLLAYVGANVFSWAVDLFEPLVSAI